MPLPDFAPIDLVATYLKATPAAGIVADGVASSDLEAYIQNTLGAPAPNTRVQIRAGGAQPALTRLGEADVDDESFRWADADGLVKAVLASRRSGVKPLYAKVIYDDGGIGLAVRASELTTGYGGVPLTPYAGPNPIVIPTALSQQEFSAPLSIQSDDVTFDKCLFDAGGGSHCIESIGNTGIFMTDCEMRNASQALVTGYGWNLFSCYLHDCLMHGVNVVNANPAAGSGLLSDQRLCYITDIGKSGVLGFQSAGIYAHPGGFISAGGTNINVAPGVLAAVSVESVGATTPAGLVFESCWLDGGQATLRIVTGAGAGPPTGCQIQNLRIGDTGGTQAVIDVTEEFPDSLFRGNLHDNTLRPLSGAMVRDGTKFKYAFPELDLELAGGVDFDQPVYSAKLHVSNSATDEVHASRS
jgi:hypothetical protein